VDILRVNQLYMFRILSYPRYYAQSFYIHTHPVGRNAGGREREATEVQTTRSGFEIVVFSALDGVVV
jgi:hypothetical protein